MPRWTEQNRKSDAERFAAAHIPEPMSGCWLWTGGVKGTRSTYGQFWYGGANQFAHRASYLMHKGAIPPGMVVCHRCDNPFCVNPDHLFLGSQQDNVHDCRLKGRRQSKLSAADAKAIRNSALSGRAVARQYSVSPSTIREIRLGVIWREASAPSA